jgi:hypothetical protein
MILCYNNLRKLRLGLLGEHYQSFKNQPSTSSSTLKEHCVIHCYMDRENQLGADPILTNSYSGVYRKYRCVWGALCENQNIKKKPKRGLSTEDSLRVCVRVM